MGSQMTVAHFTNRKSQHDLCYANLPQFVVLLFTTRLPKVTSLPLCLGQWSASYVLAQNSHLGLGDKKMLNFLPFGLSGYDPETYHL